MKKKRIVAMLTAVVMTASLFTGCGSKNETSENGGTNAGEGSTNKQIIIGLSTDEGGLNDKSFNQSADTGVKKAVSEFGVKYTPIESKKREDFEPNLQSLIDNGSDLLFAIGYQMDEAVKNTAINNPDSKIALIDSVVDANNVLSITFKEEEGAFLMGVIAGKMTKTNKVGFIGGKDTETIVKFETGFAAGVKSVNPEAAKGLISADGKAAGSTVKYADSFADTNKGYELAKSLYNDGCDIIFHAAGGVGIGMFKAAQELKNAGKDVWTIGVDQDQAVSVPEYKDVILSSMMKRVDTATYNAIKSVIDGTFKGGHTVLGLKEDGVGMADSTKDNTPEDVMKLADEYKEKIVAGTITVPTNRQDVKDFK